MLRTLLWLVFFLASALASYDYYRLPRAIEPKHYKLNILTHLDDVQQLSFEGQVSIRLSVRESCKNITLHASNLTIDHTRILLKDRRAEGNETICIKKIELNDKYEYYIMHLCKKLKAERQYDLIIPFKGLLNPNKSGYYNASYEDPTDRQMHYYALTQFSPTYARLAFPCFDEPDFKSTFSITLGYNKRYKGFSNTPIRKCKPHETLSQYVWCEHEELLKTSTYLVAYAVHNLTNAMSLPTQTENNVILNSWMRTDVISQANFSSHFASKVLTYYEQLFQQSFPLSKIDQLITSTHQFSAMENWGLITYVEKSFLYNENKPLDTHQEGTSTIAHEYAHQWFGNKVTMKWWNNVWLKEGFSTYFAYQSIDDIIPEWGYMLQQTQKHLQTFFDKDASNATRAISEEVRDVAEIRNNFDQYVYKKGMLTVRMLYKILGIEAFYKGIRKYLVSYAYDNADESDLWKSFESIAMGQGQVDLDLAMSSWTLQKGYPLLTVIRNYELNTATLSQQRFLKGPDSVNNDETCWWLPISYAIQSTTDFENTQPILWLECPKTAGNATLLTDLPSKDEWIVLNPQVNTIYRVNYDEDNWKLLTKALNEDELNNIHELNRAQLIDDFMALCWKGLRSYKMAFKLLNYLPRERKPAPWRAAAENLESIGQLLSDEMTEQFESFMRQLVTPHYQRLSKVFKMQSGEAAQIPFQRLIYKLAYRYNVNETKTEALALFTSSWSNSQGLPLSADYRDIVYCKVIDQGDAADFELLYRQFQDSSDHYEQRLLANGLGCTHNFQQLSKLLHFTLNSTNNSVKECYAEAIRRALHNRHIGTVTRNYVLNNAETLNAKLSKKDWKSIISTLPARIRTLVDCKTLQDKLGTLKELEQLTQEVFEECLLNVHWISTRSANFYSRLIKYLHKHKLKF